MCEEGWGGVWVHNEPSDVMLLVICSETRGEILLRCHCSVKPRAAGQISLTRRILWKKSQVSAIPSRAQTWPGKWGEGGGDTFTVRSRANFNSPTRRRVSSRIQKRQ